MHTTKGHCGRMKRAVPSAARHTPLRNTVTRKTHGANDDSVRTPAGGGKAGALQTWPLRNSAPGGGDSRSKALEVRRTGE